MSDLKLLPLPTDLKKTLDQARLDEILDRLRLYRQVLMAQRDVKSQMVPGGAPVREAALDREEWEDLCRDYMNIWIPFNMHYRVEALRKGLNMKRLGELASQAETCQDGWKRFTLGDAYDSEEDDDDEEQIDYYDPSIWNV